MKYLSNGIDFIIEIDKEMMQDRNAYLIKTKGAITNLKLISSFKEEYIYMISTSGYLKLKEINEEEFKLKALSSIFFIWINLALQDINVKGIAFDINPMESGSRSLYSFLFPKNNEDSLCDEFYSEFYGPLLDILRKNDKYDVTVTEKK